MSAQRHDARYGSKVSVIIVGQTNVYNRVEIEYPQNPAFVDISKRLTFYSRIRTPVHSRLRGKNLGQHLAVIAYRSVVDQVRRATDL